MGGAIPHGEGEHADQTLNRWPHAPEGKALEHNLGIGVTAKRPAHGLKFRAEFGRVVDLAVVAEREPAAAGNHRLGSGRTEVHDRKPCMAEGQPCPRIDPQALIVGSAMAETVCHTRYNGAQLVGAGAASKFYEAHNPTH